DSVKRSPDNFAHLDDVLIPAVAGGEDDRPTLRWEPFEGIDQGRQRRRIVGVIHNDGGASNMVDVEATPHLSSVACERLQPRAKRGSCLTKRPRRPSCREHVFDLKAGASPVR